jgi:hypothetical protein
MKVLFPLLQLLAGLLLFSNLMIGFDCVGPETSQFHDIGLTYPTFFQFLPVLNTVIVLLLILPLYRKRREGESWRQFFKRDWLGARLIMAYLLPMYMAILLPMYHKAKIEEIPVPQKYFDDFQLHDRLQKSLGFDIGWQESGDGTIIYFAREPGRTEKVQSALATAASMEQKPNPPAK